MRFAALVLLAVAAVAACDDEPVSPVHLPRDAMLDPQTCSQCHADHYRDWSGSMHALASDDPVFVAMNARGQRETGGALGSFCVKCHAPMAVREGATADGLNLANLPRKLRGVTCFFCHDVASVDGSHDAALSLAPGTTMRGEYADPVPNVAHDAAYSPLHDRDRVESASLCGACHDIVTPQGAPIERTFAEWQNSVFSHTNGATCGQCHMARSANLEPIAQAPGVYARHVHAHDFAAVDVALSPGAPNADAQKQAVQALLATTLQSALCVTQLGGVRVLLDNVAAGHSWPSGASQDRRAWVEVVAQAGGKTIYQSGVVPEGAPIVAANDPDLWLLRDCMFDASSKQVDMFWQAAGTEGNELPGQATFDPTDPRYYQTHVVQRFPRALNAVLPKMPDRVTMRVRLQPIGLDVLDDLVASKDLDAKVATAMPTWDVTSLLEWTPQGATRVYQEEGVPVACVTATAFNVAADKVLAANHAKCSP